MPGKAKDRLGQPLTTTQLKIIEVLADGLTNKAIARRLGISELTVKSQLFRASRRLGATSRAGVIGAAVRSGQLVIEPVADRVRVPVVCACSKCRAQLAAGEGMAHQIANGVRPRPQLGRAA